MRHFLSVNEHGVDLDVYDLHARHFGFFCEGEPAGFVRVVVDRDQVYNDQAYSIGRKYRLLNEVNHSRSSLKDYPDFPFLSYAGVLQSVKAHYRDLTAKGEKLVEASRLMLIRGAGVKKARFLIECAVALYVLVYTDSQHAVINCDSGHERFYEQYGFGKINDGKGYRLEGRDTKLSNLASLPLTLSAVPKAHHGKLKKMAADFMERGEIEAFL